MGRLVEEPRPAVFPADGVAAAGMLAAVVVERHTVAAAEPRTAVVEAARTAKAGSL